MFRADPKGQPLQFDYSDVVGGNEVFKDRQTGSRWQQSSLEAISGPLKGEHLQLFPFLLTNWGEWRKQHPNSLVLKPLPGYADRIPEMNPVISQGLSGKGKAPNDVLRHDDRLPPKAMVLGLSIDGASKAFPTRALRQVHVVNDTLGSKPILIVYQPDSDTMTAFLARVKDRSLTFHAADEGVTELIDQQTNSHWSPYGECVSGAMRGAKLESLVLEPEYWFAWSEFHPATGIFPASPR